MGSVGTLERVGGRLRGMSRRRLLLGSGALTMLVVIILVLALVPTSILGLVVSDTATFEGTPATPNNETLAETGYELNESKTVTVERTLSPGGQDRTILVENPQRLYRKHIDVQNRTVTAGIFVTVSSPSISVAGSERNPIATESHREILQRFKSNLNVSDNVTFENTSTRDAVMVGSRTSVSEFRANLSVGGERREFAIYVTKARTNGDIVVAIGGHPTAFADERVSVLRLIHAVEHQGG